MKELTKLKLGCLGSTFVSLTLCYMSILAALWGGAINGLIGLIASSAWSFLSIVLAKKIDLLETERLMKELGVGQEEDPLLLEAEKEVDAYLDGLGGAEYV